MATISHITLPDNTDYSIQATGIFIGQVNSTSTSTVYTATIPGVTEYYDGLTILLKNGIVTSASGFTININNLGAKPSYNNMTTGNDITPTEPTRDTTIFNINYTMLFVYDSTLVNGGAWICYRGYDANTNTIGYQLRTSSYTLKTYDKFRYYRILFTSFDGTHWVPANNGTDNSTTSIKTVNQRSINPFGSIVYCGNSTDYAAEATITASATWQQYPLALGYSFNRTGAALTLTAQLPVYIKCAPQSNGGAIIDSTTPYVQTLPTTEDGKIYIFLGVAYSATMIEMTLNHPVYYCKDGAIRLWTNVAASPVGVTGVKGNSESSYRTGQVNLTAANIGAASLVNGKVSPEQASSDIVTLTIPSGTTSYNLSTDWIGKMVLIEASNDVSIFVPNNSSFAIGTEIEIISNTTHTITITAAASSVSVFSLEGLRSIAGQYGAVCLKKISSSQWILAGALA